MLNWLKGLFGGKCDCNHCGHCGEKEEKNPTPETGTKPAANQKENADKA